MKRCIGSIAAMALCLLPLACSPGPVRIAVMTKLESGSLVGSSEINAARMAVEDRGMGGRVVIVPYDDGWLPDKTRVAWERLRADGIDLVVTSHVSTCALVVAELCEGQDVLVFVTGATTGLLTDRADAIIRNVPDVHDEQAAVAAWVRSRSPSRVVLLRDTDNWAYTEPARDAFLAGLGTSAWREVTVSMQDLDMDAARAALAAEPYDFLYLLIGGAQSAAGTYAQLGRLLEPDCDILFTPWLKSSNLVAAAGPALEGAWIPAFYPKRGTDPAVDGFVDRFRESFSYAPNFVGLNVYAAVEILLDRLADGKRRPRDILASIVGHELRTSFGPLRFDAEGDVERPIYMIDDIAGEFPE